MANGPMKLKKSKCSQLIYLSLLSLSLAACSGGGSGGGSGGANGSGEAAVVDEQVDFFSVPESEEPAPAEESVPPAEEQPPLVEEQPPLAEEQPPLAEEPEAPSVVEPGVTAVQLSGRVTFDFVPHFDVFTSNTSGLDYASTEARAVRGATLQLIDENDNVMAEVKTDDTGNYAFEVESDAVVKVRVRAEIVQTGATSWNFRVTDNTSDNGLYVVEGDFASVGNADQERDLHAPSGWGFPGYTAPRAAAPFAILDTVYTTVQKFVDVDSDITFPPAELRWSVNNRPETGDIADGAITTSSYRAGNPANGGGNIFILGAEDVDTDEYDAHIIVHEWGHYFEDQFSRSDSIGGPHSSGDLLDMRVAFGEGWGNALSAIILDDPIYLDSGGAGQQRAGGFNIESNLSSFFEAGIPQGWYGEFSVQSILFDLYDNNANEATDTVGLGLGPIYEALIAPEYREQTTLTSIFSFLEQLRNDNPDAVAGIDSLANAQDISGEGFRGIGETNDGGVDGALPIFGQITVNGPAQESCSTNIRDEFNRVGNRKFFEFTLPARDTYTFTIERVNGNTGADPDLLLWGSVGDNGDFIGFTCGPLPAGNTETHTCGNLPAGDYVLEVYDFENIDDDPNTGGDVCFSVEVSS